MLHANAFQLWKKKIKERKKEYFTYVRNNSIFKLKYDRKIHNLEATTFAYIH